MDVLIGFWSYLKNSLIARDISTNTAADISFNSFKGENDEGL